MKTILVLGAGHSSPYLIRYLLDRAEERDWRVVVGDRDVEQAGARVASHPRGEVRQIDATSLEELGRAISPAEVVVNLMPPSMQRSIVHECLRAQTHMLSVSYATPDLLRLTDEASELGLLMLFELGADPGIDHMATMSLLDRVRSEGGRVVGFESYGGGLPAPDSIDNPLGYAVTWNPRGVVMAGSEGALFVKDGRIRALTPARVFEETWPVRIEGIGDLVAYANRDSLSYLQAFGLEEARTVVRGTLRHPGWCSTWLQIARLGMNSESLKISRMAGRSFADLVEMFLPAEVNGESLEERTASFLELAPDDHAIANLRWLGLFSRAPLGFEPPSVAHALTHLLSKKLPLPDGGRDVVILHHELEVERPGRGEERIRSTVIEYGDPQGSSAMARAVGLPTGIAARLLLDGELELAGCHLPTERAVYRPVLEELAREGLEFREERIR